jgi:hypothetical protein
MSFKKNFSNYLHDLVMDNAKYDGDVYNLTLDDLDEADQTKLASLYLETIDRDVTECVWGNDFTGNSDYVCALLKMLSDPSNENRENFSNLVCKNVLIYFKDSLQESIDESCNDYLHDEKNENGFYAYTDKNHGDVIWRKMA